MQSLTFSNMSKAFEGVTALADVNLKLSSGRVHALMGENGAGKSTLIKLIAGVLKPDSMSVSKNGIPLKIKNAKDAHEAGFHFIHQELNIVPQVSVAENILIGENLPRKFGFFVDWGKVRTEAEKALDFLGATHMDVRAYAGELPAGDKMMMKIAAALVSADRNEPTLYVLDEPTAALTGDESEMLFTVIERLKGRGAAILYVSHRMDEILRICDDVTVLRDGKFVSTNEIKETSKDKIIQEMTGRDFKNAYPQRNNSIGKEKILSLKSVNTDNLCNLTFDLQAGEILGISGLAEAGQSHLLKLFMGIGNIRTGTAYLSGDPLPHTPSDAWTRGVAYVPRERRGEALCLDMSVRANIVLSSLVNYGFYAKPWREIKDAFRLGKKVKLKSKGLIQAARQLSGGNQQKIVFARAIQGRPKLLLLDEPTRGVDIGAKYDIYLLLRELSRQGCAVILTSTDLPEVLGICDRVLVMQEGCQAHLIPTGEMTSAELLAYCYPHQEVTQ
ncbi:MAG: sugar ABC transporter ATP-binding protein [Pseudomonadota bacterium]|nr:sugar ABC transporter ATP-binding protein [Pseudomonadota bacterium]